MSNEEKNIKEQNDMEAIKEMEMQLHEQFASNYNNGFSATITLFCTLLAVLYGYGYIFLLQRLLLATVMILNYVVVYADNIEIDGICYSVRRLAIETYDIAVTNKDGGYSGDIVIPQTINYDGKERQVTSIDHRCFSGCKELTSVKIPDGVTSLKQDCFMS